MTRKLAALAVLGAIGLSSAAQAEEHTIVMLPEAIFPEVTYVNDGDTVIFVNEAEGSHNLVAKNESWETPVFAHDEEHEMVASLGMQNEFYLSGDQNIRGVISFQPPPLD